MAIGLTTCNTWSADPIYQGRTLSDWLNDLRSSKDQATRVAAKKAVQATGTNAVPHLLREVEGWSSDGDDERKLAVLSAFEVLGASAESALPQLADLLGKGVDPCNICYALGRIGPKSVDVLTQALTNENVQVRFCAAVALADSKLQAVSAVPELVNLLKDSSRDVRRAAVEAIGVIRARPEIAVPSLIDLLKDNEVLVRLNAAKALGRFGAYAKAAVPILEKALNDDDPLMRKISEAALRQIRGD